MRKLIVINDLANRGDKKGLVPYSAASIWRKVAARTFPAPFKLSTGRTVWDLADVEAWVEAQVGGAK